MDVFEDVATILRIILDYVGIDADDLVCAEGKRVLENCFIV
jgi:hypothetical protein